MGKFKTYVKTNDRPATWEHRGRFVASMLASYVEFGIVRLCAERACFRMIRKNLNLHYWE